MKYFSQFRFDDSERKLWLGSSIVPLTRKAADLLACLIAEAGTTVTHQRLMQCVWPDTHVQQENIKVLVHELRHALGDSPDAPKFVQSEAGRGYSFVAAVAAAPCPILESSGYNQLLTISRDYVLAAAEGALDGAINMREGSCMFIEGLAGSGKTTVCREIHRRASRWPFLRMAYGRAHRTNVDPFPAIVALLERLLARYPALVRPVLSRRAPTWFAHLSDRSALINANVEQLAVELVDALGDLGQNDSFLLVMEDLHWSAWRTMDLLSVVEAEVGPGRIVIVATYSPFGSMTEFRSRPSASLRPGVGSHLSPLQLLALTEAEVEDYLERRFGAACAGALTEPIHGATLGHAASVARIADGLVSAGVLQHGIAGWSLAVTLRRIQPIIVDQMAAAIRALLTTLGHEERHLLEAAASIGWKFTSQGVAKALGLDSADVVRDGLDLLAMHLPVIERDPSSHGKRSAPGAAFRFRHRQWFEILRIQPHMTFV